LKNPGSTKPITNNFAIVTLTTSGYVIDMVNITNADGLELYADAFD
jgi:hypothetical protein